MRLEKKTGAEMFFNVKLTFPMMADVMNENK